MRKKTLHIFDIIIITIISIYIYIYIYLYINVKYYKNYFKFNTNYLIIMRIIFLF